MNQHIEAKAVTIRRPKVLRSRFAGALGGKLTKTVSESAHKVRITIGKRTFLSDKDYSSRESATKAAKEMSSHG